MIHGDYNEQNLVVEPSGNRSRDSPHEEHDIVGVIDFGDMSETYYVYEVRPFSLTPQGQPCVVHLCFSVSRFDDETHPEMRPARKCHQHTAEPCMSKVRVLNL